MTSAICVPWNAPELEKNNPAFSRTRRHGGHGHLRSLERAGGSGAHSDGHGGSCFFHSYLFRLSGCLVVRTHWVKWSILQIFELLIFQVHNFEIFETGQNRFSFTRKLNDSFLLWLLGAQKVDDDEVSAHVAQLIAIVPDEKGLWWWHLGDFCLVGQFRNTGRSAGLQTSRRGGLREQLWEC